jgi:hypothetical protein
MSRQMKWVIGVGAAAFAVAVVFLTMQQSAHRYEVCVTFQGRSNCATAAGSAPEEAIQTAHTTACALLAGNREENIRCLDSTNRTVRQIAGE